METLSPAILEIRNSFLEKFKNENLDTISKKLTELFVVEKDPVKKLVLLASRVENIRDIIRKIRKIRAELSIHPKEIINVKIYNFDKPRYIPYITD